MPKIYEANILAELGDMAMQHKVLYLALWELANPIGVVVVNLAQISALAGYSGCHYIKSDLDALGKRVVWLDPARVLLPKYLVTTVVRLSPNSRGQHKVFDLIRQEWGASKFNLKPFYYAWDALGCGDIAPLSNDVYEGEERKLPAYIVKTRKEAELAHEVLTPPDIPADILHQFDLYTETMYLEAMQQTTIGGCNRHRWTVGMVLDNQAALVKAIQDGIAPNNIINSIRSAKNKFYTTILFR